MGEADDMVTVPREALEPFLRVANGNWNATRESDRVRLSDQCGMLSDELTVGDFRRLAAAVEAQSLENCPDGWVMVPKEPVEVQHAALTALGAAMVPDPHERDQWCWFAVKAYRVMVGLDGLQKMQITREGEDGPASIESATIHQEARPADAEPSRAIHYVEADRLEYVSRDVPTFNRPVHPGVDVLLDMESREPIGWCVYGWSKVQP